MIINFEFKLRTKEKNEEGYRKVKNVKYLWNVPEKVENEALCYFFANQYGISTRQAEDIMDEWGLKETVKDYYETEYADDLEYYIRENYKDAAFKDYQEENEPYWDDEDEDEN